MTPVPRWYQIEAEAAIWQHLCNRPGNPLVDLPTGSGKSLVIAMTARRAVDQFKGRCVVLADRKELLQQNAAKIRELMPNADIGIYSAGLKSRDLDHDIIVAGIQSIYNKAHLLGRRHLILPDECHKIGDKAEGMYRSFYTDLGKLNPNLRAAGFTATPYRTGEGTICRPDSFFQEICYTAPITRLIAEGFLSRLITTPADNSVDTSKLHIRGGEFKTDEMEELFAGEEKVNAACLEIIAKTLDRKSILVFCPSVFHAQATAKKLEALTGQECGLIVGDKSICSDMERAATLQRFKDGLIRWCVNVDVLTTGFDSPRIDAIAILRATMSPGLFAQICGRGLRLFDTKADCLILDFGQNIRRHGPLDSDDYGKESQKRGGGSPGDMPMKTCPGCGAENAISARYCSCGLAFPPPEVAKHEGNADSNGALFVADIKPEKWIVESVRTSKHFKKGDPEAAPTFRIDYLCTKEDDDFEEKTISEFVCIEHQGYALGKAHLWWKAHTIADFPDSVDAAIDLFERGAIAMPSRITTKLDKKFLRIVEAVIDEKPETWAEPRAIDTEAIVDDWAESNELDEVPF